MIIDIILDRKDGAISYDASKHLKAFYDYATDAGMTELATAVDGGTEDDVKATLMCYISTCGYPLELLDYIARVHWTDDAPAPQDMAEAIEDALRAAVKALPFSPDDIFRGTGDGTREYTALFTLQR